MPALSAGPGSSLIPAPIAAVAPTDRSSCPSVPWAPNDFIVAQPIRQLITGAVRTLQSYQSALATTVPEMIALSIVAWSTPTAASVVLPNDASVSTAGTSPIAVAP